MKVSDALLNALIEFEGKRNNIYKCQAGLPTIGVGHVIKKDDSHLEQVTGMDPQYVRYLTDEEIMALLRLDITVFENAVHTNITRELTQRQFDALVSFAFNVGGGNLAKSTLRRLINTNQMGAAVTSILSWCLVNKRFSKGLYIRRVFESSLLMYPDKHYADGQGNSQINNADVRRIHRMLDTYEQLLIQ